MKKLISYIFILSILLISSTSCSNNEIYDSSCTKGNIVTFNVLKSTPHTYSEDIENIDAYENNIDNIYAIAFDTNNNKFSKLYEVYKTNSKDKTTDQYTFSLPDPGTYKFTFIANPNKDLKSKLNYLVNISNASINNLKNLLVTQSPNGKTTTNSKADNFLMTTSPTSDVTIKHDATNTLGKLSLKHLSAKFKLFNEIDGLIITKITFNKRTDNSYFTDFSNNLTSSSYSNYPVTIQNGSDNSIATFYSYEIKKAKGQTITLKGTYTKDNVTKGINHTIDLKDYEINRNNLYNITLKEKANDQNITYNINIESWKDGETIEFNKYYTQPDFTVFDSKTNTEVYVGSVKTTEDIENIYNPDSAKVTISNATNLLITVYSNSTECIMQSQDELPGGCEIIDNNDYNYNTDNKKASQTFTLKLTKNYFQTRKIILVIYNKIDMNSYRECIVYQSGDNTKVYLPIETMCKYNIGIPGEFAKSNFMERSGYFNRTDIQSNKLTGHLHYVVVPYFRYNYYYNSRYNNYYIDNDSYTKYNSMYYQGQVSENTIIPNGYHLPTIKEWKAVLPFFYFSDDNHTQNEDLINPFCIFREENKTFKEKKQEVLVPSLDGKTLESITETSDYKISNKNSTNKVYALRYKNDINRRCAYRYEVIRQYWHYDNYYGDRSTFTTDKVKSLNIFNDGVGTYNPDSKCESEKCLRISVIRLGENNYTLNDIAKTTFWENHKDEIISRTMPTTGYISYYERYWKSSWTSSKNGQLGWYYPAVGSNNKAATPIVSHGNNNVYANKRYCNFYSYGLDDSDELPIRPFKDLSSLDN